VEWIEINNNAEGEDMNPNSTDAEAWRPKAQTGLDRSFLSFRLRGDKKDVRFYCEVE